MQDVSLSVSIAVALPLVVLVHFRVALALLPTSKSLQLRLERVNSVLREQLQGTRVLRAFGREQYESDRLIAACGRVYESSTAIGYRQAIAAPLTMLILNVGTTAIVWFAAPSVEEGRLEVGALVAFLSYFGQVMMSALMVTSLLSLWPRAVVCAGRVRDVTHSAIDCPESARMSRKASPPVGAVEMRSVAYRYDDHVPFAVRGVSFEASPGTVTAITGPAGAGKSTLLKLLGRLLEPDEGFIRLAGNDMSLYEVGGYRRLVGYVAQRAELLSGTVAENLQMARPGASVDDMWQALHIAQADTFVQERPEGLLGPVLQGGVNFSGGQRQRLALARAVVRRPLLYLLDEPLSALDAATAAAVFQRLRDFAGDAIVIIVSRSQPVLEAADQIVVMDGGYVTAIGNHARLAVHHPAYRSLMSESSTASEERWA